MIGIKKSDFLELHYEISKWEKCSRGKPKIHSLQFRLALTLIKLKQAISFRFLSFVFRISLSMSYAYFSEVIEYLYNQLSPSITIPTLNERKKNGKIFYDYFVTVVLDGTEQMVVAPKNKFIENGVYSGKYQQHTFTKLIACSSNGKFYFIGNSYAGSLNDKNLYDIKENWIHQKLESYETIAADKGFLGN